MNSRIEIIPVRIEREILAGDALEEIILGAIADMNESIADDDIVVIAHKIISKSEERTVDLRQIQPSKESRNIAEKNNKDPRLVELIIRESKQMVKNERGIIIVETKHGFVCANAGIDRSNVAPEDDRVLMLPDNPDLSAAKIRNSVKNKTGKDVAVIVSDTFGRPFREGQTNMAIGVAGIGPIKSYIGQEDIFGKKLNVTEIAIVDEIASAAELAMGKIDKVPVVIIRGYRYRRTIDSTVSKLVRLRENDLFRGFC